MARDPYCTRGGRQDFYCKAIIDTATWRPDDAPTSREVLEQEVEDDGTAADLREDATLMGQDPDLAVEDYVSGMLYAIENKLDEVSAAMHTLAIRAGISRGAAAILLNVRRAMNAAEEIGGPEGDDYIRLMRMIADDAKSRVENYSATLKEDRS